MITVYSAGVVGAAGGAGLAGGAGGALLELLPQATSASRAIANNEERRARITALFGSRVKVG
jgi:hypothetical protein